MNAPPTHPPHLSLATAEAREVVHEEGLQCFLKVCLLKLLLGLVARGGMHWRKVEGGSQAVKQGALSPAAVPTARGLA